jgi:hypothetical protein
MMRRIAIFLMLWVTSTSIASSVTLSDLTAMFRSRVGETDTAQSSFTDTDVRYWMNQAQDKINGLTGSYQKSYNITWTVADSLGELLPSDFVRETGVMVWVSYLWEPVLPNEYFGSIPEEAKLGAKPQYFTDWTNTDSARIYCKNLNQETNRVRLFYVADPADLDTLTDTCRLAERLQVFVIEEAFSYYLGSLKRFQEAQAVQMQVRQDLGITKSAEVSK